MRASCVTPEHSVSRKPNEKSNADLEHDRAETSCFKRAVPAPETDPLRDPRLYHTTSTTFGHLNVTV